LGGQASVIFFAVEWRTVPFPSLDRSMGLKTDLVLIIAGLSLPESHALKQEPACDELNVRHVKLGQ
jgi:hypothetical protein